mgnify:CR=1 FL=1
MHKASDDKVRAVFGIRAKLVRREEEFIIDTVNHTWIYEVETGLKLFSCQIQLPKYAENIHVVNTEHNIHLQPKENMFELEKRHLPYLKKLEASISFSIKPRFDQVILYQPEEPEASNREWIRIITVQNIQDYDVKRIRLERMIDFEPSDLRVEEITVGGPLDITSSLLLETCKDSMHRTIKCRITWETNFSKGETKRFRLACKEISIPQQIADLVNQSNLLFNEITSCEEVFKESMRVATELHTPCRSERDFTHKVGVICNLFEIELKGLRKLVKSAHEEWGSIRLIEELLDERCIPYDREMIQIWQNIVDFRNASSPFHPTDSRVVGLCEFFGQSFPPNYSELWKGVMLKFRNSLEIFVKVLQTMRQSGPSP